MSVGSIGLRNLRLKLSYSSGEDDLVDEFFVPCLRNSTRYDRAVGFFTAQALFAVSKGLHGFVANRGAMRLVCSPKLTEEDISAIERGYKDRGDAICRALLAEIDLIPESVVDSGANYLSWLIATDRTDIKVAMPERLTPDSYGIYHEKIGLFYDAADDIVAFSGSNNETLGGLAYNYESFDVYRSWMDAERCQLKARHFSDLWNNKALGVITYSFPEAARKKILQKIRPQEHPSVSRTSVYVTRRDKMSPEKLLSSLWWFQEEALSCWEANGFNGILSMATATGKTRTAIGGIIRLFESVESILVVISCPQNTIMRQWERDAEQVGIFDKSVIADGTNPRWPRELADAVIDLKDRYITSCVVYTTYNTLCSEKFTRIVGKVEDPSLLICDEVHWAGAATFQAGLLPVFRYRLGLSATPARHMDEEGSDKIYKYFREVVYEFGLDRALTEINPATNETFLTPYDYHPLFVSLDEAELLEYRELSRKIARLYAKESRLHRPSDMYQRLCEKRQAIIVNAASKFDLLKHLLKNLSPVQYLLLYCSPEQIDKAQDILNAEGIVNHRFTGQEGTVPQSEYSGMSERDFIIARFERGDYRALAAMKCLDEGVNILRAETAVLMASSRNPRQYIQRRGRLLRRHPEKKKVCIYDIIVVPYLDKNRSQEVDEDEVKILKKEFERYEEFSSLANNRLEAMNRIFAIKAMYGIY